ncbi:MAG: hypothetical protein NTY83_03570 [Candidatus Micrarchaeota archaeon]|nr:hypothetical protein [Candidatus Micrarchaeota archaeon]
MNNMPDDGVINKPPAKTPSPAHTQRFRVPTRPRHETTGMYKGIADLTLKRVQESRLAQDEIASIFSRGGQTVTSVKNILRNAVVEEDRLAHFVCDNQGKRMDIDAIRDSLIGVSEFAPSAKFDHPEGGTSLHLSVAILYCNEPVGRRFLFSNAPISILGILEKTAELDVKFYNCITGRRSITLAGRPGEYRYIYLATPEIERAVLGMCERYPATDSTLVHLEELRHSSGSAPVIDLPTLTKAQEKDNMFMTEQEKAHARKRETSIPAPATSIAPPVPEQAPKPEAPSVQEASAPASEAVPAGKRVATNTLGLGLEDLEGRRKVGNEADLKKMFDTAYSSYVITTEGGHSTKAAEETRFVTFLGENPEFLPACELEEGDIIYRRTKAGLAPEKISGIKKLESGQGIILPRIRIEKGSMLFAEGFAVYEMAFLLPGSMVDTTAGGRKAEELGCGDELISFNGDEYGTARILDKLSAERGFIFRGMEVELTSGMRLLMVPIHPQKLADKCPAILDYADTQRYMEVEYENGKKISYVLVKPKAGGFSPGFSLTTMENTLQVLEDLRPVGKPSAPAVQEAESKAPATGKAELQPPATVKAEPQPSAQFEFPAEPPAPALPETAHPAEDAHEEIPVEAEPPREAMVPPSTDQVIKEKFDEVRKFAFGILGNSPIPPEEAIFGENIAMLVQAGKSHYLVTNAEDWNAAREAMEKHLSSETEGTMLTEIQNAYAHKRKPLPSGGEVTILVKPVGKSRVYKGAHGESHSDTLEVMPRKAVEVAIAKSEVKQDPEAERRRAQAVDLLRGAVLPLAETNDEMLDIFMEPDSIVEAKPSPERWYLLTSASNGKEYAIFRFPCEPAGLSQDVSGMPAAVVFTHGANPGYSYVMIETRFLSPALTEMMLSNWKAR